MRGLNEQLPRRITRRAGLSSAFLRSVGFLLLPGFLVAAEPGLPLEQEDAVTGSTQQPVEPGVEDPAIEPPHADTHASREASTEVLLMANEQPEKFIDRTLVFANGETIGKVMHVRRRVENDELYLIVDATEYFNDPTEYAVPVNDIARIESETIVIREAPGMHLRGMEYYPEDYIDVRESIPIDDDGLDGHEPVENI